jgi:hypothetical protein
MCATLRRVWFPPMMCRVIFCLCFAFLPEVRGEAPPVVAPTPPVWLVVAECEMVILPQKAALPLIAEFSDDDKADAAWDKVQKMIESGEATLAGDLMVKGGGGQTLISETVEEVRYAKEFKAPALPDKIPADNALETLKAWPAVAITPTAFEKRKVGQMLTLSVSASEDGKWLNCAAAPEHVRLLRWDKFEAGKLANGDSLSVQQPQFHSMKNTTSLRLRNGQKTLLGVHKVPGAENSFEFFLLRVSATKAGARP